MNNETIAPGDPAAMREALIVAKANLDSMGANALEGELNLDAVAMICASMSAKIDSALAAPARNCDRYRTEADAEAAFDRFCMKTRTGECKPWECPLRSSGGKYCFVAWLLGTEGGAE